MADTSGKLNALFEEKSDLSDEDGTHMAGEHGEMIAGEAMDRSAAIHEKCRAAQVTVTME